MNNLFLSVEAALLACLPMEHASGMEMPVEAETAAMDESIAPQDSVGHLLDRARWAICPAIPSARPPCRGCTSLQCLRVR